MKGNRSDPKTTENYYVLRETDMPAVLLELGFMDSTTDVPIILTEEHAEGCARAIVETLVERGGLTKKEAPQPGTLYRVQVGAFVERDNAERLIEELQEKGYKPFIVRA